MEAAGKRALREARSPAAITPFLVLIVVAVPQVAWANAGTPLMWAGMLHLLLGNAFIGMLEGVLLQRVFHLDRPRMVFLMVLANYVSAWVGGVFMSHVMMAAVSPDLYHAWGCCWAMVGITYAMTVVLEWPFIAWICRGTPAWFSRSLSASLLVQTVSYVLLFAWYWAASGTSLYTGMEIVSRSDLTLPESVHVYFIDAVDGTVYRAALMGGDPQPVCELGPVGKNDRLYLRPHHNGPGCWDMLARLQRRGQDTAVHKEILTGLRLQAVQDSRSTWTNPPKYEGTGFNFGEVPQLGAAAESRWKAWAGFWAYEGLRMYEKGGGESVKFSFETPFAEWLVRNATHLPGDTILFQLGNDQICVFDPVGKRVALLWHGRGPVAIVDKAIPCDPCETATDAPSSER